MNYFLFFKIINYNNIKDFKSKIKKKKKLLI